MSVGFSGEYDDNVNSTSTNRQGSFRGGVVAGLQANIPRERTFFRMRYNYAATYTPDYPASTTNAHHNATDSKLDQAHIFDGLVSHTFSPRLVLNVSDALRRAVEPGYVDVDLTRNVQIQRRGDYLFNLASTDLDYKLSRRWTATLRGSWELWRYDEPTIATNNDRDIYTGALDVTYAVTPRTFTGVGYQHSTQTYDNPGSNDTRNSQSDIAYVSLNHAFNPQLSANSTAGIQLEEFGDGTKDTAPSVSASINYNYSRDAIASIGFRYSIAATEVGAFRSTEAATTFARLSYKFTPKFGASANGLYSLSTFQNPVPGAFAPGSTIPHDESIYSLGLNLNYNFTRWCRGSLNYNYDHVISDVADRNLVRNRGGLTLTLFY